MRHYQNAGNPLCVTEIYKKAVIKNLSIYKTETL